MGVKPVVIHSKPTATPPKILHTGDWHLGHARTSTIDTVTDIRDLIFPRMKEVDMIVIVGDVLDREISFNSSYASIILDLFVDILKECYENGVILRVVRGTYTHDNSMLGVWDRLFKKLRIPVDFALVNTLSVEHIKKFDIDILYMPDNLPYRTKTEVLDSARTLLKVNGLQSVDFVLIHGEFDHVVFGRVNANAYNASDFSNICHGLILAGHVHKPHRHKNIVYSGSINRLAHNEEEDKGFWIIIGTKSVFIKNPNATKFITVDYRKETQFDELLSRHTKIVDSFGTERLGFLRLSIIDTNLKQAIAGYHNTHYPNIKLSFKPSKHDVSDGKYLNEKLKKKVEVLEAPSLKNVAAIVCKHLLQKGICMELSTVEMIINQ